MNDPDRVLKEIRQLTSKFRDARISWDDSALLGELVDTLDRMACVGVLPAQWRQPDAGTVGNAV